MTIPDVHFLGMALMAGIVLGIFFFGGLWWTVRKGLSSGHPAAWFVGSLLLRTSIVLGGFYVVSAGHWDRLLACLLGFLLARIIVTLRVRATPTLRQRPGPARTVSPVDPHGGAPAREAHHAP